MKTQETDIVIVGGGPVGLMCAYLGHLYGLKITVIDKSAEALQVGRADALNARTLQLLELAGLFNELYPLGKICNTSSVWANGNFVSRQSSWWDNLEGCLHKHFLMLGQSHIEQLLDRKLKEAGVKVMRLAQVIDVQASENGCQTTLLNGEVLKSKYIIGADGSRSIVRELSRIPFQIVRPEIIWAVIDGVIESDFPKVPEIIVFQNETSDVAWIPREGKIDRFYVRMDQHDFSLEDALAKIRRAMSPHTFKFSEIEWSSKFSVKESVAEKFSMNSRIFLAGDACHIHSVNGGQGLNTGLADAFNLMWKLSRVIQGKASTDLLCSYEKERKPVALSVVESSGELVRSTKYSEQGTHALDYVKIVEKRAGNITGMGIHYGQGLIGNRLFDFEIFKDTKKSRLYSHLDYTKSTLLIFGEILKDFAPKPELNFIQILNQPNETSFWSENRTYNNIALLVRPDSYIESSFKLDELHLMTEETKSNVI